jgi:hypothetical protein
MNMNKRFAVFVAISLCGSAVASAKTVPVSFAGCTFAGVEGGCLMVRSGTKIYNISAAQPRPALGRAIAGTGTVHNGPTTCMQGTPLKTISWHYIHKLCPKMERRRTS